MKKSGIPLKHLPELSSSGNHHSIERKGLECLRNSITMDQKGQLIDLSNQLNLLKRLMDGEEIDD